MTNPAPDSLQSLDADNCKMQPASTSPRKSWATPTVITSKMSDAEVNQNFGPDNGIPPDSAS
jgi:hypothetical protein